jgi:hypothetical protein
LYCNVKVAAVAQRQRDALDHGVDAFRGQSLVKDAVARQADVTQSRKSP